MDPADLLFARLALARNWISREVYEQTLARVDGLQALGFNKTVEDVLREGANLDDSRLRVLRRLLSRYTQQARVGDYLLVRQIGTGGTGLVFEGRHRRIGRRVALKILFPRLEKEQGFADRFLREATVLARINHPNVVHAYDAGQDGDFYYIATEMVDGRDLRQILEESGPLSLPSFVEIATAVSRGLQAIHDAGLLHRDIKPANILVSTDPSNRPVKLVDFGLVFDDDWSTQETSSSTGRVLGTPEYMSPEHIRGDALVDRRSDLYSLGVTFYHMLSGRVPFSRSTPQETLRSHLEDTPESLAQSRPELPHALVSFVESLMARDPADRPETAMAVARALEAQPGLVELEPVPAVVPSPGLTAKRRRLAWVVGALLVFLVGLGFGLIGSLSEPRQDPSGSDLASGDAVAVPAISHESATSLEEAQDEAREALRWPVISDQARGQWQRLVTKGRAVGDALAKTWRSSWSDHVLLSRLLNRLWRSEGDAMIAGVSEDVGFREQDLEMSMPLAHWIVDASRVVHERFSSRLAQFEDDQTIRALLRRHDRSLRRRVWIEDTLAGLTFVDVEVDERYALDEADPLMVLEWSGLASVTDGGLIEAVGYLISTRRADFAGRLTDELGIPLSREQREVMQNALQGENDENSEVARSYFERLITAARLRRRGELALRDSRWMEARQAYDGLLALGDVPDSLTLHADRWELRRERAKSLTWLTGGVFHGRTTAVDARRSEAVRVDYVWDAEDELRDMRTRPGAWILRCGELATATSSTEFLDTVAFFRLPVQVEVQWSVSEARRSKGEGARLAVVFDTIGLGMGGPDEDLQILELGSAADGAFLTGASTSSADFVTVEWTTDRIIAGTRGGNRIDTAHGLQMPTFGRVGLRVDAGVLVQSLSIQAELEPVWAQARREYVEKNQR